MQLAETFGDIARTLLAAGSLDATLQRVVTAAVETVPGCDHAGISFIEGRTVRSRATSDEVPVEVDKIQYEVDEGPCLDAMREHEVFSVDDLSVDSRWPQFSKRAAEETGVLSMLSFRLFVEQDTMGALNLYSKREAAFPEEAHHIGAVLAAHAAIAIVSARMNEQKDEAIRSRDIIGQAKGIIMARKGVSEEEAFDILRRASQRMNVKLRDIATQVTKRTAEG